jgi:ornithine carbamoyltransferase
LKLNEGFFVSLKLKDMLSLDQVSAEEILKILNLAIVQKADPNTYRQKKILSGRGVGLFFEKASLRTRLSFETAITQLGGQPLYMGPDAGRIGERESIKDLAKVSSRYLDAFILRTYKHETLVEMAKHSSKPVINGLSDTHHPCQALGDLLTIREKFGKFSGLKLTYVGDCNNVCRSLALSAPKLGIRMTVSSPQGYNFPSTFTKTSGIQVTDDPMEAVKNADIVYTDVWTSMGQESESAKRRQIFQPYQINSELLNHAPNAIVLHCLPAHRGDEITDDVIDGPKSVVYDQAENRLHAQRALLSILLE